MDCFIKKISEGKNDEYVHSQFQKFSRGEFQNRAMLKIKNSKGKYVISSTSEYAKELVLTMAEKLGKNKTRVTGALISALDLSGFEYKEKKSAIGVRKYIIDNEMTGEEIVKLCSTVQKAFFGLSFSTADSELIIKVKSPKSSKGVSSAPKEDSELKIDFCKLKTSDKAIIDKFAFDSEAKEFTNYIAVHSFIISDIVIPSELKNEKDFSIIREKSLRKGKVIREITVDSKKFKKEYDLLA